VQTIDVLFEERYDDGSETNEVETEPLRLAIDAVVDGDQTTYVVVGSETEVIDQPIRDVLIVEAIIGPALLALVAALTWVTADRALRPVEAIRSSAAAIRDHREAAEVDVPDTGDEIERLAATINEMLARLAAADERQRRFIGDASHELKSPLANLRMEIETGGGDRERHLAQIDRLTALVDDLLVLSVLDADRPLRSDRIDLDDVVFDVLGTSARRDGLTIDIDGVTPTRVVGDGGQLRRLVRNLVENANRHADSRVAVALSAYNGVATLHVDDDGPGLDPDAAEVIFERFGTLSSSRARDEGGTGLGLAIAARIVDGHEGAITVGRSDLGGARFSVALPIEGPGREADPDR
jgi:signal transduction histidine kinase